MALVVGLGCSDVLEALSVHHSWWRFESMIEGLVVMDLPGQLRLDAGVAS
jgi:hypothetical protein